MTKVANKELSEAVDRALNLQEVSLRVDVDLYLQYKQLSIIKGKIVVALMRCALKKYMKKQKKKLLKQVAKDLDY